MAEFIYSMYQARKAHGDKVILDDVTLSFYPGAKIGVVGPNGMGKSTLLKIMAGIEEVSNGDARLTPGYTVGILQQEPPLDDDKTVIENVRMAFGDMIAKVDRFNKIGEEMCDPDCDMDALMAEMGKLQDEIDAADGWDIDSKLGQAMDALQLPDSDMPVNVLSGGERSRLAMIKLLLEPVNFLILDEPTNHLDMESISWLENYLLNYNGAVLIVAHDRYFLDKIVSKIIEIDNGDCTVFSGNYTDYASKKAILRNMKLKEYLNQQRDIKHQEEVIAKLKQFNREKSIKRAESREKMLDKMEIVDKPVELNARMNIQLEPSVVSGNDVLTVTDLTKSFDGNTLFNNINFEIKRGERVALIGNNGTGKTTILKLINGIIQPDNGSIYLGAKVAIGYYDQEHHVLDPDKTLFQEIQDAYPDLNNTQIRNTLAAFLFTDDDVFKYIRDLSGGERGRVSLAKLMLSNANLLILDEPTNHLDIVSKEILENALNSYTGTVLYVSHDRYFINATATRIIELTNQNIVNYIGNYDYYLEKRDILTTKASPATTDSSSADTAVKDSKISWQQSREEQNRLKKRKNEIKRTEERISVVEERLAAIDAEYSDPSIGSNTARLMELHNESSELQKELDELYEHWDSLMEEE